MQEFTKEFPYFARGLKYSNNFTVDRHVRSFFSKAMPDSNLDINGDKCKRGKLSKESFTIIFYASFIREKLKPVIVGKFVKPEARRLW